MNKYNNPRLLNTVVSGTGMKNPVRPHVIIGSEENGFIRGDLMDANAIQELIVTEIAAREHGDEELTEYIDEKVQLAVDDLVDGAPEVLDTLKELSEALGDDANFATTITEEIASKVDKVEGKGLSTNDYTNAEKQKLAGIAAGAEVNVQSDWNVTSSSNDAFIKNKPTKLSQFENDVPYTTQDYIDNNFETKTRVTELKQSIKEKIDNIESVLPKYDPTNGHEYVDLGLPSGTLWATCNVGASSETDYGLYFQWGDTQGYTADQVGNGEGQKAFTWSDYKFNPSGDGLTFTKYNETDGKIVLDLGDDAARVNWGGVWRMPTEAECQELIDNTNNEWVTVNNVDGYKFTSKTDSSKYIFIPAAGMANNDKIGATGSAGYVCSSSRSNSNVHIEQFLYFFEYTTIVNGNNRCTGFSVRGVINKDDVESETFAPVASKDDVDELKENLTFTETTYPANGHEYVDLGLPSGTKWATMNVGATSETDYGLYFQWGDTQGYTADQKAFAWTDYKYSDNGISSVMTKYNATDGKTVLDLEDDAARANWGGDWHMPTKEQCEELFNTTYVTNAWVTNYNGSGINGRLFTSVNNGNTMFLPDAGFYEDDDGEVKVGGFGTVWASTFSSLSVDSAWGFSFNANRADVGTFFRYAGMSVRGVLDGDAQGETIVTSVKEVVTDLKSNEEVIAAALNNLNTKIEATNLRIETFENVTFEDFKGSIDEDVDYFTKFTPNTVGVDDAAGVFNYNVNQLQELVTNNNTEMLLTTTRNNKKLIVGTIRFFTDNFAHQVTAIATSNIHLDEWDKESSLSGVSHTDGKAYTYVCFCGLNDPAAYSGLQEGVWTDWKKLYPTMDDLDEAVNTLKNRQYMDSSTFDAIFTEADSDAIDYIIDNFAPTFYVKGSSNSVVTCSVVRSATQVCVFRNKVDEQSGNAIQECRRGTIGVDSTITWGSWMNISSTISQQASA